MDKYNQSSVEGFKHQHIFMKRGDNFLIEIKHTIDWAPNQWNVYAFIYPDHALFDSGELTEDTYGSGEMPLHCGSTYCRWHKDTEGNVTSKQYGSDYAHYMDNYRNISDIIDAPIISTDANNLFNYLTNYKNK